MEPLKIALVASEVAPFAKTGGLADVVAALGRALHRLGHDVRIVLPRYGNLREGSPKPTGIGFELGFPDARFDVEIATAELPRSEDENGRALDVHFVDCPRLFHRADYYTSDEDEPLRWCAFSRAVLEFFQHTGFRPDVIHANDWHTGLLPLLLNTRYAWDSLFADTRTLLSIHNLGYQGAFPASCVERLGLEESRGLFHQEHLEEGRVSFLETGIIYADWLSTVSETYAREIQTDEQGMGLAGMLRERQDHLVGITNGIDPFEWNPATDPLIPTNYSSDDLKGKSICRSKLLERFNLNDDEGAMVIGVVSRMTAQKGFELLPEILTVVLQRDNVRLVVLGSGDERYERYFQWLRDTFPDRVGVYFGYSEELAHWVEAGSDLFLMPSRYEPCGLNQMYSLAYGTVPLVRATGGLADTVERFDPATKRGTGFVFWEFTSDALMDTIAHAYDVWQEPGTWSQLVKNGMTLDHSWETKAERYVDLYRHIGANTPAHN